MKRVIAWALVLILCLGMFAGCKKKQQETPDNGGVNIVDTADLEAALEYVKTVYRKVSETTPADYKRIAAVPVNGVTYEVVWTTDAPAEAVKIVKGDNGMVTVDVNEESKEEVPYVLTATISDDNGNSVSHDWKHILPAGMSSEDMVEIVKAAYALENGASMGYDVTLRGKITMINTPWSDDYQNITVTIVVEGAEDMPIQCYRLKGEGAKDLRIGDIITVTGELKNYNGTIEFDAGCTLDAVVKGEEVKAPEDPKQIVDEAYALGANESLPYEATLTGVITEVGTPYNAQYGNVTVTIVVEGRESKPIVCYRLKGKGADQIGVNDLITVKGYITNYVGSKGKSTIEFTAGCQLISWEDRLSPTQPSDPKAVVDAAYALGANETLKYEATLTGRITKVNTAYDPNYGNVSVTIVIEGRESKPILCYRMKGAGVDKIGMNDIITVKGYITNYVGDKGYSTIEYNYPELVSYTKNTVTAPTDSAEIVKAAYALAAGTQLPYEATVTGKITKVNTPYDPGYKNVTVTIVVPGAEDMPLKCYRLKGTGADQIGVGDTITVKGYIENYVHSSGDTEVEFTAGCQLVSWDDTGANVPEQPATVISIADAIAKGLAQGHNNYTVEKYKVTGVIKEVYNTMYGNMKLMDDKGNILTIYGSYDTAGNRYDAMATKPVAGDTVTIEGPLGQYNDAAQIKNGIIVAHTPAGGQPVVPPTPPAPSAIPEMVTAPAVGTAYKLYMNKTSEGKYLYFNGKTESETVTYRLATTENAAEAVDVYLENVSGGYALYFNNAAGQKTYIRVFERDAAAGKGSLEFVTSAPADVLTYDSTYNTLIHTGASGNSYFMGTYSTYVTFSVSNTSYLSTDNVDVSQFPGHFGLVTVTEDPTPSEPTVPSEPTEPTEPNEPEVPVMVTDPVVDVAYKLYMNKTSEGKYLYFNGQTESETVTYRLATTEDAAEAVDVYLEQATGGYYLYFNNDAGEKVYIRVYERDAEAGKGSLELVTEAPAEVLTYDETFNTFVLTGASGNSYYMGTYNTFTTFSVSNTSYLNEDNLDVSQFPAHLTEGVEPSEPAGPETPVAGTAYKMYMNKTSDGKILYFNGQTESETVAYRLATTENAAEAVDVFVEETTGGYYLYFNNDAGEKVYIRVYERDAEAGKGSLELVTEAPAEVLTYDETFNTLILTGASGNSYYMGTYSTFTTFSVSNTSYLNEDNLDVSQFPAHFTSGNVSSNPTDPEEPGDTTDPITPVAPEAGIAYHMFMNKTSDSKVLFFNGQTESETVTYRLATTETALEAVQVFVEETTGGYYLYFNNEAGEKVYIRVYERDAEAGKGSLELVTEAPAEVLVYDSAFDTLIYTGASGNSYYMGTYSTYTTFSVSNTSYLNADNLDVSQFPAHFVATTTSDDNTGSGDVEIGKAYKLFMNKTSDGKILYFNGQTESETVPYRLATTEVLTEAVDVFVEETTGGYHLYFNNANGVKTYIRVYERDAEAGKGSLELVTEAPAEALSYDSTYKTFIHTGASGNSYYMGTYSTYTTFSVSNTSYLNEENLDVSQFPAHLKEETAGGNTEPSVPGGSTEPTNPSVPDATEPEGSQPTTPPAVTGAYSKIDKVADLTAGTYLLAAYSEAYNSTDFSANPWHFWDGNISSGNNFDLLTNTYAFANGELTKYENAASGASKNGNAVEIELVAVDGKDNTYYIKLGDLYLSSNGYEKRRLQLTATAAEWVAEDTDKGGIVLHQYFGSDFVTMGFGGAASNMIRGYKSANGEMNTGIKSGLYFFTENN